MKKLETILNSKNDNNLNLFMNHYNKNILSKNSIYELLKKEYKSDDEITTQLKKELKTQKLKKIMKDKKISIIIPTYNRKEQLKECLDSILNQTYSNFEIIIIDDCSSDNTYEYIKKNYNDTRIIYVKNNENHGAGYNRKKGYNKSTGDFVIFCDDDDYYIDNEFFENCITIFNDENISVICSNTYNKYEKENKFTFNKMNFSKIISSKEYLSKFQFYYSKPNSTFSTIFRKITLDKSEFKKMKMVNDSAIYLRALLCADNVYINDKIIGVYRIHSKNITFNIKADFLIENLDEKKYVYDKIKKNNLFSNADKWFYKQIFLTIQYYLIGSNPNKSEMNKITKWINENVKNAFYLKICIFFYKIKLKIKKIIRKVVVINEN